MISEEEKAKLKVGGFIYYYDDVRNLIIKVLVLDNYIESREIRTDIGCLMNFSKFLFITKKAALEFAINYQRDLISIAEMKIPPLIKQLEQEDGN